VHVVDAADFPGKVAQIVLLREAGKL
jgi:hypothetical protein